MKARELIKKKLILLLALSLLLSSCSPKSEEEKAKEKEEVAKEAFITTDQDLTKLLSQISLPNHFKGYFYKFKIEKETNPDKSTNQRAFKSQIDATVIFDGQNKAEIAEQTTTLDDGQSTTEFNDSYFMRDKDMYTWTKASGPKDKYYKEEFKVSPEEVSLGLDFTNEGRGLEYSKEDSTDKTAVYKRTFKDQEIIAYYLNDNPNYVFEEVKGTLEAVMKIDRDKKQIIEYSYKLDMDSLSSPSDDYLKHLYELTDKSNDYEDYAEEYKKAASYKAHNKVIASYTDFVYDSQTKLKLSKRLEEAKTLDQAEELQEDEILYLDQLIDALEKFPSSDDEKRLFGLFSLVVNKGQVFKQRPKQAVEYIQTKVLEDGVSENFFDSIQKLQDFASKYQKDSEYYINKYADKDWKPLMDLTELRNILVNLEQ